MMQKKKLKLLLAGLAASTILFAAPLSVEATGTGSTSGEPDTAPTTAVETKLTGLTAAFTLPDTANPCEAGCIHVFTAESDKTIDHTVQVISGTHTIYLRGTWEMDAKTDPAFKISGANTNVTLALEKDCEVTLSGEVTAWAGLQVEKGAKVTIRGLGKLIAQGGSQGGAGIGGNSNAPGIGKITIQSGEVEATGGGGGAGIGSGYNGGAAESIEIKGGKVTATGSNGVTRTDEEPIPPGPGIGSPLVGSKPAEGILGNASGNVTLSGGEISAFGGTAADSTYKAGGIQAESLSSDKGSTVIYTNDTELSGVRNSSGFNAIIWEKDSSSALGGSSKGTVWGNASLKENLNNQELRLMSSSSLTIAKDVTFDTNSKIIGNASNKIIDIDKLLGNGLIKSDPEDSDPELEVSLSNEDFYQYSVFNDNKEQTFSGMDKDFTDTILKYRPFRPNDRYGPLRVTKEPWGEPVIQKDTATVKKICKAGNYTVTYQRKEEANNKFTVSGIKVKQRDLSDSKVKIVIPDQVYTGEAKEPEVSILLDDKPLELEKNETTGKMIDYTLTDWENNINVGEVSVKIEPEPRGNLTYTAPPNAEETKCIKKYNIIGVPLTGATVVVDPISGEYNGTEHKLGKDFNISVSLEGTELINGQDYEAIPSSDANFVNAGDIVYTIKGINNYGDSTEAKYTINKKAISINDNSLIAEPKEYDGNGEVTLTVTNDAFDGIVDADKGKIRIKSKGIVDANNEGHAGTYSSIHFDGDIELEYEDADGNRTPCTNYILTYNGEDIPLKEDVVIEKATPTRGERELTHVDPYAVNANGLTFDCTVEFERQRGITYQFKMDGDPEAEEGWTSEVNPADQDKASAVFRGINPATSNEDKHVFYVRSEGTDDVVQVLLDRHEVVFKKLPNPKTVQNKPTISYNEEGNPDKKTYTVTLDKLEESDIEYRIIVPGKEDGVEFGNSNVEPLAEPGTTYVGQVRYKATEVYEASEPVSSDEIKTPPSPLANSGPKYKTTWKRIIPNQSEGIAVPPGLQEVDYTNMQEITADLTRYLSQLGAYQDAEHTAFYDVKVQVITRDETGKSITRDALPGDFENGGISVTLPSKMLPQGVTATENQFSAVHMFETDDYAEYSAGDIEICADSEGADVFLGSGKGVTFTMNGASPVGIAWSEAPEDPGTDPGTTDPGTDPGTTDPGTTDPGTTTPNQNQTEPLSDAGNQTQSGNNNQTGNTNGNNTGTGTGSQGQDSQSIADALKSAVSSLAPKTGDTSKLIMWAVIAAAACIAVIVAIRSKIKSGKKGKVAAQKVNAAAPKSGTSAKKTSTSAATTKKTTTTTKKSTGTTASKKTSTTAKKSTQGTAKKTTTKK